LDYFVGAQSGGVVTYEPTSTGQAFYKSQVPIMRGKRSRVVNSKRTTLSQGVRSKIEKDNCSSLGTNLSGWNSNEFNDPNGTGKRLVRGFFGHTRFATSSIAPVWMVHILINGVLGRTSPSFRFKVRLHPILHARSKKSSL
jgi:hypothetical protein